MLFQHQLINIFTTIPEFPIFPKIYIETGISGRLAVLFHANFINTIFSFDILSFHKPFIIRDV